MDLLLVEDDDVFRSTAAAWMSRKGIQVAEAADGRSALAAARLREFDVAVLDLNLPDGSGLDLFAQLRKECERLEVLFLTGQATVEIAVEAMKQGACDFLCKPFPLAELEERCRKAAERGRLAWESQRWKALANRNLPDSGLVGDSPGLRDVVRLIQKVGPSEAPILIQGETGTGKELAARAIQKHSLRGDQPFVTVNCAALPESLVESELFGHEKGAFTGATARRAGLFEMADGGTLFIDEIGELPIAIQPKLLRVLEDGSLRRIGGSQERRVNVRVVAATNRDLSEEVREGRFREDLLYRINVMPIHMPPLREHAVDIPRLIQHFLPSGWTIEADAQAALVSYNWPGNVRQLRNVLERATILAEQQTVTLDDLPAELLPQAVRDGGWDAMIPGPKSLIPDASQALESIEREHVRDVLRQCQGNKTQAARLLGVHRRKLYRLLERLGLATDS